MNSYANVAFNVLIYVVALYLFIYFLIVYLKYSSVVSFSCIVKKYKYTEIEI